MALFFLSKGLNLFEAGVVFSMHGIMIILLELPTGGLADQIGRKTVYLISSAIVVLAIAVFLSFSHITIFLYIAFGMMGAARSLSTGTIDAWFVDEFKKVEPDGDLQKAFAVAGIFTPAGLALGTLVGGGLPLLSTFLQWERYTLNLVMMLIAYLWVTLYTIVWITEHSHRFNNSLRSSFQNLPQVLNDAFQYGFQHKAIFLLMTAILCWGVSVASLESLWQPQVKWILGSEEKSWVFGLLSSGYFAAAAMGNVIITPICRLFKNRYAVVLVFFRVTMGISFFLLAYQTGILGFGFAYLFLFLQNGFIKSPHEKLFHELVPDEKRSTMISIQSMFMGIGGVAGNMGLGWVANNQSIPFAWNLAGIIFCSSSLLYVWFSLIEKNH